MKKIRSRINKNEKELTRKFDSACDAISDYYEEFINEKMSKMEKELFIKQHNSSRDLLEEIRNEIKEYLLNTNIEINTLPSPKRDYEKIRQLLKSRLDDIENILENKLKWYAIGLEKVVDNNNQLRREVNHLTEVISSFLKVIQFNNTSNDHHKT